MRLFSGLLAPAVAGCVLLRIASLGQSCDTTPVAVCYRGVATPGDADEDPSLTPLASWIWFGAAGDSIQISASPQALIATSAGQERDALQNTAPRFRHRLQTDGVVLVWLAFDEQGVDTLPYTLRVWSTGSASRSLRATGQTATLTVVSRRKNSTFSLVPASVARTIGDRSQWRPESDRDSGARGIDP